MNDFHEFNNYELAFLFKYKMMSYLPNTRNSLKNCIKERGLNEENMKQLIEEKIEEEFDSTKHKCPRCKTQRTIKDTNIAGSGSYQYTLKKCDICGLDLTKGYKMPKKKEGSLFRKFIPFVFKG